MFVYTVTNGKTIKILLGPLLAFVVFFFLDLKVGEPAVTRMAAVAIWMATWWLTEAVPLAVTALLPVILLPLLGIGNSKTVAAQYMDPVIFLFMGGFLIAFAIEKWELHRRIALRILMIVGTSPSKMLMGVMLTSFLISMWISNTATTLMLLSAVFAVIYETGQHTGNEEQKRKISAALLIGLAYSASIGGMATLVGTPTNMIFLKYYKENFAAHAPVNFFSWFVLALPLALVLLCVAWFILRFIFLRKLGSINVPEGYFRDAWKKLGPMTYEEKAVSVIFVFTALAWFTRSTIDFGWFRLKGWEDLLIERNWVNKEYLHDSTVAIAMAVLLFLIPSRKEKGRALMTWKEAQRLPFDIVLLFGGGFALAKGVELSGLDNWLAERLGFVSHINIFVFILLMCALVTVISEFASNVACIQLMLPVLASLQSEMQVEPLVLLVPATLAASLGFMLPVATAPNTIVFGSKLIRAQDMFRAGLLLDIAGVLLIALAMMLAG